MNKSQIFGMYLGQGVLTHDKINCILDSVFINQNDKYFIAGHTTYMHYKSPVDDCQLILKPISEMSEGDYDKFSKCKAIKRKDEKMFPHYEAIFWLIEHGYALDDTWFEQGIAVKESEVTL